MKPASPSRKSPKKTRPSTGVPMLEDSLYEAQSQAQVHQFNVAERDVEIERMKITLDGLNSQLVNAKDYQAEGVTYHTQFVSSEQTRTTVLQVHMEETAKKILVDTDAHNQKHEAATRNADQLQQTIRDMEKLAAETRQAHLTEVNNLNVKHASEIDQKLKEAKITADTHTTDVHRREKDNLDNVSRITKEHADLLTRRDSDHQTELRELDALKIRRERDHLDAMKTSNQKHDAELRELTDRHMRERREQNEKHDSEMRTFRDEQERKDQENRLTIDEMRSTFSVQLKSANDTFDRDNRAREDRHKMERENQTKLHDAKIRELTDAMESLRFNKDTEIKSLQASWDVERCAFRLEIDSLKITISKLEATVLQKTSIIISLEETLFKKKDVEAQLAEALTRENENRAAREALRKELEHSTDYVFDLEEKVYRANKTSLELLKQLKDAEVEIETLKQYIIDLKQRIAVYIPVKEDNTDKRLAEYINNYPERSKLKIMFMRETSGVYQFGTKRVQVKVERDNIKIRVGGGYLSIDQFLEQYTPQELEKLERKDPLKRMSEKIAIQSTIKDQVAREDSPVRRQASPSPKRKNTL